VPGDATRDNTTTFKASAEGIQAARQRLHGNLDVDAIVDQDQETLREACLESKLPELKSRSSSTHQ